MHDGNLKPGQLDEKLVTKTYNDLNEAAASGYGKGWTKFGSDAVNDKQVLLLQQNIFRFSGAKTYTQLMELNSLLVKDGKQQSWPDFKADALKVNEKYNVDHLQAEHQTATRATQSVKEFNQFKADVKIFPNVIFRTAGDKRVRESHRKLEGTIVPVNSAFLDRYMTPLGYRCRCRWVQTAQKATRDIPDTVEGVSDEFKFNPAKTNQVFNEGTANGAKPMPQFIVAKEGGKQLEAQIEAAKLYAPYTPAYKADNGSKVEVSPFADLQDFEPNLKTAKVIADALGIDVKIRPHLNRTLVPGKNPEYEIKGRLADRKGIKSVKGVADAIDNSKSQMMDKDTNPDQKPYIIVFDLSDIQNLNLVELKTMLNRKITDTRGKNIHGLIMVNGKNSVELLRDEIVKRDYAKLDKIQ